MPFELKSIPTTGCTLWYGESASAVSTEVGNINDIEELPVRTRDEYETTRIDQKKSDGSVDWNKKYALGYADNGSARYTLGLDEDQADALRTLDEDKVYYWEHRFPSGAKLTFKGKIITNGFQATKGQEILQSFGVRLIDECVFVKATA